MERVGTDHFSWPYSRF